MTDKELVLRNIKKRYGIIGDCEGLNDALITAQKVAQSDFSVLVQGENGVGKEIIPRIIHDLSPRSNRKYLAVNCGAIPEGTIESELFGHVKGAYTGSVENREGYFSAADGGTLFLDEVGELPISTQARLLRVLETGEYIPVGATDVRKTDVRVVAATNVNMQRAISEGRFREDLYYRLNSIPIHMPPLRERGDDIPLLFRFFAMQMAEKYKMEKVVLTDEARAMLMRYKWPGNIRQLKNVTEQISILSPQREITAEVLSEYIPQDLETTQLVSMSHKGDSDHSFESEREILYKILYELRGHVNELTQEIDSLKKKLNASTPNTPAVAAPTQNYLPRVAEDAVAEEYVEPNNSLNLETIEKQMLVKALERNNGNRKKAAEELGYSDRTLYRRLKQYGLEDY